MLLLKDSLVNERDELDRNGVQLRLLGDPRSLPGDVREALDETIERLEGNTDVTFLKSALEMLVDGYDEGEIRDILTTEMYFFRRRRQAHERVFRNLAQVAPAFGVAGSVVGLVGMLTGLGDTGIILKSIPIALTSTLYGVVLGNFVFNPIAESICSKTEQELLLKQLIVEGVAAVHREPRPTRLERKLLSFLTPAARPLSQRSFDEIRKKYRRLRLEGDTTAARDPRPASQPIARQGWRQLRPPGH